MAIDLVALDILSNHLYILAMNLSDVVQGWSDRAVAIRWLKMSPGRWLRRKKGIADGEPPRTPPSRQRHRPRRKPRAWLIRSG